MNNEFEPIILNAPQKIENKIFPYLSFPLTKFCQFKCLYCGVGGETTASYESITTASFVIQRAEIGYAHGVRKFRLTGGEPLSHPEFEKIVDSLSRFENSSLLINTNGDLLSKKSSWLNTVSSNVRFAVSLDSLEPSKFDWITGSKGHFDRVIAGIRLLASKKLLTRLNLVVTKHNVDEVFSVIDFCKELGCNLKLLEVCSVPIPYSNWEDFHVKLDDIERQLVEKSKSVAPHEYSKSFGIPMPVYNVDGVNVTVKSSLYGSRYDAEGICKGCNYFPCHEGLYDMYLLPDDRLCGCRWSDTSVAQNQDFRETLDFMVNVFQRAEWQKIEKIQPMKPLPSFVCHNLKKD